MSGWVTWKEEIVHEMDKFADSWDNIEQSYVGAEDVPVEYSDEYDEYGDQVEISQEDKEWYDVGFDDQSNLAQSFVLWTKQRIYFSAVQGDITHVRSFSRNPSDDNIIAHVGLLLY